MLQLRLRGGVDDIAEALLHGIIPEAAVEEYMMEDELDGLLAEEDAAPDPAEDPPPQPGACRILPKRPTARFYCEVADEKLYPGTDVTVNQAVYCALKIKVDYNIHDLAFDSLIKFTAAILPSGHFLPGYATPTLTNK